MTIDQFYQARRLLIRGPLTATIILDGQAHPNVLVEVEDGNPKVFVRSAVLAAQCSFHSPFPQATLKVDGVSSDMTLFALRKDSELLLHGWLEEGHE